MMSTNPPEIPSPSPTAPAPAASLGSDWSAAIAALLAPTVVTTILGGMAAIVIGAARTFGPPVDLDLVYLGLGLLAGVTVTRRA